MIEPGKSNDLAESLLEQCLAAPDEEREELLEQLAGAHPSQATDLRERFAELRDAGLLDPAPQTPISSIVLEPIPGEALGPYQLIRELGRGGMGTVYLAEQQEPVNRPVALKVIKPGMDSEQVLLRFAAERQAMARMDHAGIAKVYDAGTTPEGRPYFAMEYVPGDSITAFCDRKQLPVRERLELFVRVCNAVQHAHHKGIIHRDLKPSNVLVREEDEQAVPRVIDFGLARATDQRLTDTSLCTVHGTVVGTPEYMSPEQAGLSPQDVDTRTDVYSLGVILYELLAGALPLESATLRDEGPDQMRRRIREEEPPRPSTRITSTGPASELVARRRRTSILGLSRELAGDLDWITMMAIEKDRDRRYQTAAELAADVGRFLRDEPVVARPPTALYRLGKLYRRHRLRVIAAASTLLAILGGLIISTALYLDLLAAEEGEVAARTTAEMNRDALVLSALLAEADDIRPAWPEDVAPADRWLAQADALIERLTGVDDELAEIESRSEPIDDQPDRPLHAHRQAMEAAVSDLESSLRDYREYWRTDSYDLRGLAPTVSRLNRLSYAAATLPPEIEKLRRRLNRAAPRKFEQRDDQERYRALTVLATGAETLAERRNAITKRRARALAVDKFCFEEHRASWERTIREIADVAAYPQYDGLKIRPQRGLVPLGPDPHSRMFEFGHFPSGEVPTRDANTGLLVTGPETCLVFVLVPGGMVRAWNGTPEYWIDSCLLSKYEMTQGQWTRLTGENPSHFSVGVTVGETTVDARHPVTRVSWHDAMNTLIPLGLTLPKYGQWALAGYAGKRGRWLWGNDAKAAPTYANLADASMKRHWKRLPAFAWDDGYSIHAPVGSFEPNDFGFYDMCGNVTEWLLNEHTARPENTGSPHLLIGWSFFSKPSGAGQPGWFTPFLRELALGVRPARELER